jgi:DNA-binding response OmpR family regulator
MGERILIIEDEDKIARVLSLELEHEGYQTDTIGDGRSSLEKIEGESWDLILLDIMLPKLSGIEVLRRMRRSDNWTPVILLTAKDAVPDKVTGLDLGANDYVTKPFDIEELLARIRACLRTSPKQPVQSKDELHVDGKLIYEVKLEGSKKGYFEVDVDTTSGKIVDTERKDDDEDVPNDVHPKINIDEAKHIALGRQDGQLDEIELDQDDGKIVYKAEIKTQVITYTHNIDDNNKLDIIMRPGV